MTLRRRLALVMAAVVALAVAVAALVAYDAAQDEARGRIDQFLVDRRAVASAIDILGQRGPRRAPGPGPLEPRSDVVAQILTDDGAVIPIDDDDPTLPVTEADLEIAADRRGALLRDVTVGGTHYRMSTRSLRPGAALQVARDLTETDEVLAALRLRLLLAGMVGVLAAALVGVVVARRLSGPIREVADAAEHVAESKDLDATIAVKGDEEIARLAGAFNEMLAALAEARTQQQRLVADASHELRTPLTSLRTNVEVLARGSEGSEVEREAILTDLAAEIEELTALVAELVDLATLGDTDEPLVTVDLGALAEEAAQRARRRTAHDVTVAHDDSTVEGRPGALARALDNLVRNAAAWSPESSTIEITVDDRRITVRDHGPGIADDDLPHVFERFYRSTEARGRPGSGLGLAIVARVARLHGGEPFADAAPGGGARVGFTVRDAGDGVGGPVPSPP
jgi:two-component system sensor histidine kinase MprB